MDFRAVKRNQQTLDPGNNANYNGRNIELAEKTIIEASDYNEERHTADIRKLRLLISTTTKLLKKDVRNFFEPEPTISAHLILAPIVRVVIRRSFILENLSTKHCSNNERARIFDRSTDTHIRYVEGDLFIQGWILFNIESS